MNRRFPLPFVWDGLKLEMLLNDVVLQSGVISVGKAGPCLLSSLFSLTMTFIRASESHFSAMSETESRYAY